MCRKRIVLLFLFCLSLFSFSRQNGKGEYIIHVVKFGETLSKISREYGITVTDILNVNPSLAEINNLNPEQLIRIPNKGNKKIITNYNTVTNELQPKVTNKQELIPKDAATHTVEKGQTLYSISKMYNVKLEDLQKWNNLSDYNVKIGSQIIVGPGNRSIPKQENIATRVEIPKQVADTESIDGETETPDIQASENASQKELGKMFKDKKTEGNMKSVKGTGAPMTTSLGSMESTYFAMHKSLPIGTIIKIKNLVNSKIVYAKVIGKLPETDENKHVIVRYTLGVKKDLQLQNGKCYVQIEYTE